MPSINGLIHRLAKNGQLQVSFKPCSKWQNNSRRKIITLNMANARTLLVTCYFFKSLPFIFFLVLFPLVPSLTLFLPFPSWFYSSFSTLGFCRPNPKVPPEGDETTVRTCPGYHWSFVHLEAAIWYVHTYKPTCYSFTCCLFPYSHPILFCIKTLISYIQHSHNLKTKYPVYWCYYFTSMKREVFHAHG